MAYADLDKRIYRLHNTTMQMAENANTHATKGHRSSAELAYAKGQKATRADRRIAYANARKSGCNIKESSRAAGVNYSTGMRWERELEQGTYLDSSINIRPRLSKDKALAILADRIENPAEATNVVAQAVSVAAKLEGWEAPTRIQQEVRIIPQSVVSWIDTVALPAPQDAPVLPDATVQALPAEAGGEPPTPTAADSIDPPPNFSEISGESPK